MSQDTTAFSRAAAAPPSRAPPGARQSPCIEFRRLEHADLRLLHGWLREPEVARWYSSGAPTRAAVRRKYLPRIEGRSPTQVYIARVDARDAGLVQTYSIDEYPAYAEALEAGAGWAGLDYFLGEPDLRGRRLAHRLVGAFVDEVVAARPGVDVCASLPALDNVKSVRTLERAGFRPHGRLELTPGRIDLLMIREIAPIARAPSAPQRGRGPDSRAGPHPCT